MIGDIYDICCEECGRYLFTEKMIQDTQNPSSFLGKTIRENDCTNYIYQGKEDRFICNECIEKSM